VEKVRVRWLRRALRISVQPNPAAPSVRLELWGAARKKGLLEEVAGAPVEIVAPDGSVVEPGDEA
jgi:hypothetical protein